MTPLPAMQRAASALWAPGSWWHPGGLAWQRRSIEASPVLLLDGGWGWVSEGRHLDALVADLGVADEVVAWFLSVADGDVLTADAAAPHLAEALRRNGFRPDETAPFNVDMRRAATGVRVPVPAGYALRAFAPGDEDAYVACHRAAWDPHRLPWRDPPPLPPGAASTFDRATLDEVRATAPYRDDLVVVAVAEDGRFAACCIAWLDAGTGVAEIEPLGVVPEHRGRGLGRAVTLDATRRAGLAGAAEVTIHPRGDDAYPAARRLYASCGFTAVGRTVRWRLRRG